MYRRWRRTRLAWRQSASSGFGSSMQIYFYVKCSRFTANWEPLLVSQSVSQSEIHTDSQCCSTVSSPSSASQSLPQVPKLIFIHNSECWCVSEPVWAAVLLLLKEYTRSFSGNAHSPCQQFCMLHVKPLKHIKKNSQNPPSCDCAYSPCYRDTVTVGTSTEELAGWA